MNAEGEQTILIGISGKMASGKGSVSKYLAHVYHAERHRSSDPLRAMVDIFDIPQSRVNLSDLSTFLRECFGEHVIAQSMRKLLTSVKAPIAIFDGMRRLIDIETFRSLPNFIFIFVDCDERIRYERYVTRNENAGDSEMTFEDFKTRSMAETEIQIDALKEHADVIIDNNSTYDQLIAKTKTAVENILK